MMIGGVWVEDRHVRALAAIVDRSVARRLEQALLFRAQVVAMTRDEKRAVLSALERAPAELDELRDVLLANEDWLAGRGSFGAPGQLLR
jgi:hypothetical protein